MLKITLRRSSGPRPFREVYEEFDVDNARFVYIEENFMIHTKFTPTGDLELEDSPRSISLDTSRHTRSLLLNTKNYLPPTIR